MPLPCPLMCMPAELLEEIAAHLGHSDTFHLGSTCKDLRHRLAHRMFHTIAFSNDARHSDWALASVLEHGEHVRKLTFVGHAGLEDDDAARTAYYMPGLEPRGDPAGFPPSPERGSLPKSCRRLFRAPPSLLPKLEEFAITFSHDFSMSDQDASLPQQVNDYNNSFLAQGEHDDDVAGSEERLTMRRLWRNVYGALCRTESQTARRLTVRNWVPRPVSVFWTAEWFDYLSRCE